MRKSMAGSTVVVTVITVQSVVPMLVHTKPWPQKAMGILADADMRNMKVKCHTLFDSMWKASGAGRTKRRKRLYVHLAELMSIPVCDCHFGYFTMEQLKQAYEILNSGKMEEQ